MGIPELWKELGDGEITSLAKLSSDFFIEHGRPLRIAIDEPSWRFNNLTETQVYAIQQASNEPAYRGIEKHIFYRLAKVLQKSIQPLFVFDGPGKPWKGGKVSGRPKDYWDKIRGVRELLDVLKIPNHVAPGEAEAECARLQQERIVDAVWSEDADALMFGAGVVIRDHRVAKTKKDEGSVNGNKAHTKKSGDLVRVYRLDNIECNFGLNREALVCFVLLNGGDYASGLRGCGPKQAMAAARSGLGKNLYSFQTEYDSAMWRLKVAEYFGGKFDIPPDFARSLDVKNYCHPKVSSREQLHNVRCLQRGWDVPLNEEKVRDFISTRFNMWTKSYMDWIGPILLVRSLLSKIPDLTNNIYSVKLTRRKKKQTTDADAVENITQPETEVKLTFLARSVTSLDYDKIDDGHWLREVGIPPDLGYRVECEIPYCFLRGFVPDEVFETSKPGQPVGKKFTKGRTSEDIVEIDDAQPSAPKPIKKRKSSSQEEGEGADQPRKRGRPPKKPESGNDASLPTPVFMNLPRAVFRLPTSIAALREISSQEDDDDDLVYVGQRALVAA